VAEIRGSNENIRERTADRRGEGAQSSLSMPSSSRCGDVSTDIETAKTATSMALVMRVIAKVISGFRSSGAYRQLDERTPDSM
jgi:hypothetical protein